MSGSDKCLELKVIKYALLSRIYKTKLYVKFFSSFSINSLEIMEEEQSGRQNNNKKILSA